MTTTEPLRVLAPLACNSCKQSHRRCDKNLPACGECTSKHKICIFEGIEPTTLETKIRYEPYPTRKNSPPIKPPAPVEINITTLLDHHMQNICAMCMLDRDCANVVLAFVKAVRENKAPPTHLPPPPTESMALVFAFQALFYRKHQMYTLSQRCFDMSKKLISSSFDQVLSSMNTAFTYFGLGCCLLQENETERAQFYFENGKSFVEKYKASHKKDTSIEGQILDLRVKCLDSFLASVDPTFEMDLSLQVKRSIFLSYLIRHYQRLVENVNNEKMIEGLEEFSPYLNQMKQDMDARSNKNFTLDLPMLDRMISTLHKVTTTNASDHMTWGRKATLLLYTLGAKIQLLQRSGHRGTPEIRGAADYISVMASNAAGGMLNHVVGPIIACIRAHLECLEVCASEEDSARIVNVLKADATILKTMMDISKRVASQYGYYVLHIANIVAKQEEKERAQKIQAVLQPSSTYRPVPSTPEYMPNITSPSEQNIPNELEMFLSDFCKEKEDTLESANDDLFWQIV